MSDTAYQKHIEAGEMSSAPGYPNMQNFAPPGAYPPNTVASPLMVNVVPAEVQPKQGCDRFLTLGIIQIVCAVSTWIICVFPMVHCRELGCIGAIFISGPGFPSGIFYLVAGILGVVASTKRTSCVETAFLVLSIIATICGFIMFFDCIAWWAMFYGVDWLLGTTIPLAVVSLLEAIVAVVSCATACRTGLTCCTCCCEGQLDLQAEQGVVVFHADTNQSQYPQYTNQSQ